MTSPELVDGILAVLARWYPDDTFTVTSARSGVSTPVFRVEGNGQTGFVRLGEHPGERRIGEITAHRYLSVFNLPIPRILAYDDDPPELDRSIALTSMVPGVPLLERPEGEGLEAVGYLAGATLAVINQAPVSGYGWVSGVTNDGMLEAAHQDRVAWAAEYVTAAETVADSRTLPRDLVVSLYASIERWADLPAESPASLAHGDVDSSHIYVDPESGEFTGIIDFGEIRGADRLYDLGHLYLHDGEASRPAIFPHVLAGFAHHLPQPGDVVEHIRLQALAIATRALAIQLTRPPSPYRDWLTSQLGKLLNTGTR